jgi:hypothetical protein
VKYVVAMVDPTKSTKSPIKKKASHESVNTLPKTLIKDERSLIVNSEEKLENETVFVR